MTESQIIVERLRQTAIDGMLVLAFVLLLVVGLPW